MASGTITSSEYISHHLTNLTFGNHPENGWSFAHSAVEAAEMGFWAINVDTMLWSLGLGILFLWLFRKVAKMLLRAYLMAHKTLSNRSSSLLTITLKASSTTKMR